MLVYNRVPVYCMCATVMLGGTEDEESWDDLDDDTLVTAQSSIACRHQLAADRLYSKETVLEHVGSCEGAKALLDNETSILKRSAPLKEVDNVDEFRKLQLIMRSIRRCRARHQRSNSLQWNELS